MDRPEKLLRPLHRQRTRRRARATVLASERLAEHFDIDVVNLEAYMHKHNLAFHKDSRGEIWASIPDQTLHD